MLCRVRWRWSHLAHPYEHRDLDSASIDTPGKHRQGTGSAIHIAANHKVPATGSSTHQSAGGAWLAELRAFEMVAAQSASALRWDDTQVRSIAKPRPPCTTPLNNMPYRRQHLAARALITNLRPSISTATAVARRHARARLAKAKSCIAVDAASCMAGCPRGPKPKRARLPAAVMERKAVAPGRTDKLNGKARLKTQPHENQTKLDIREQEKNCRFRDTVDFHPEVTH